MAQVVRPLRTQHPLICSSCSTLVRLVTTIFPIISTTSSIQNHYQQPRRRLISFVRFPLCSRNSDLRSHGLKLSDTTLLSNLEENESDSDYSLDKKSRNEKKREARKAVKWGMELATFSTPQIKRIVRIASLEREVYEAIMLVKRLGSDVREGKRRQFNYIGRLLRNVEHELMDTLIQATKDGDNSKLEALSGPETKIIAVDEMLEEIESEEEEEESNEYIDLATRWCEGLVDNNPDITKEVYSIHSVEFDRQELRKLVREVHSIKERQLKSEGESGSDKKLVGAKKSLVRFLHSLAKQMPTDSSYSTNFLEPEFITESSR